MDFSAWNVDLERRRATHECGFYIEVEGNPADPSAVNPGRYPAEMDSLEKVRLLRTGIEALRNAGKATRATRAATRKPPTARPASNRHPGRKTLSLKKPRG